MTFSDNGQVSFSSGPGTVAGDFSTPSTAGTTTTSGLFAGCPDDSFGATSIVEICLENFTNTTNNSGADLGGTQIFISINNSGPIGILSNGNAFGGGGSMSAGPVTMCYTAEAGAGAGPDNSGAQLSALFAGLSANGLTISLITSDGFGTSDEYAYDNVEITINDQTCVVETPPVNVCDCSNQSSPLQINVCASSNMMNSTIIYVLVDNTNGDAVLQTNQTGTFTSVADNTAYTVYAFDVDNGEVATFNGVIPSTITTGDPIQSGTLINPDTVAEFNYDLSETMVNDMCDCCSPIAPTFLSKLTTTRN